eukprot:6576600-Prymnesium_polylepis.1
MRDDPVPPPPCSSHRHTLTTRSPQRGRACPPDPDIYDGADFDLVSNYPRRVFGAAEREATLEELGLHPQAMLFTKEQDD